MTKDVYKAKSKTYGELTIKYMDSNEKWITEKLSKLSTKVVYFILYYVQYSI